MKKQLLKGNKLLEFSKKLFKKHQKEVINLIEDITKNKFKYRRFNFGLERGINYWALKKNKIIIGSESIKEPEKVLGSIIHEMIHINTYDNLQKEYAAGKAKTIEIWTVDKTNEILKKINSYNKTNFKLQNYD